MGWHAGCHNINIIIQNKSHRYVLHTGTAIDPAVPEDQVISKNIQFSVVKMTSYGFLIFRCRPSNNKQTCAHRQLT